MTGVQTCALPISRIEIYLITGLQSQAVSQLMADEELSPAAGPFSFDAPPWRSLPDTGPERAFLRGDFVIEPGTNQNNLCTLNAGTTEKIGNESGNVVFPEDRLQFAKIFLSEEASVADLSRRHAGDLHRYRLGSGDEEDVGAKREIGRASCRERV